MSNRMCAFCNHVVSNTCWNKDHCPVCECNDWADPLESHGEWEIIRKLQTKLLERTFDLKKSLKDSTQREHNLYHENEKLKEIVRMYKDKTAYNPTTRKTGYWAYDYIEKEEIDD